jgi:hypothetical protein
LHRSYRSLPVIVFDWIWGIDRAYVALFIFSKSSHNDTKNLQRLAWIYGVIGFVCWLEAVVSIFFYQILEGVLIVYHSDDYISFFGGDSFFYDHPISFVDTCIYHTISCYFDEDSIGGVLYQVLL